MADVPTCGGPEGEPLVETIVRREWGRLLSSLIGSLQDFQLAEDSLQDAVESALHHWGRNGPPRSPAGWLLQVARRKAIDRLRRSQNFQRKQAEIAHLIELENEMPSEMESEDIPDERLRLIFTCCHPALAEKSRVALTLRTLGGLTTGEIARAFLDAETTMAQRLVRAKRKIKTAGIAYMVPGPEQWTERLGSVLNVIYLIFNEGWAASSGSGHTRVDLSNEAIRLARGLNALRPGEAEVEGLLALMLLHDSRREARNADAGRFVALEHQDRTLWDKGKIREGRVLVKTALARGPAGPFQIQAAISAVHAEAGSYSQTGWQEIVQLYDVLYSLQPSPVVILNQAVARSNTDGPQPALEQVMPLAAELDAYQPFHAAIADFHRRLGNQEAANLAYRRAIELSENETERAFLTAQLAGLSSKS